MAHKEKKQKKNFGFFWTILFLLALSVFCFSAYQLFDIYRNYKQGVDEYLSVSHETVVRNQEPLVVKEQAVDTEGIKGIRQRALLSRSVNQPCRKTFCG